MSDQPLSEFERDTAVTRADDGWVGDVSPRWSIGSNPNGGYLVAMAARAMLADSGQPDPWTLTAHFLSPPVPGPVTIRTQVVKPGRTYVTVSAGFIRGAASGCDLVGAFGDLAGRQGPTRISTRPPEFPPPDECVQPARAGRAGTPRPRPVFAGRIRDPGADPDAPWGGRGPADRPFEITGWIRFSEGTEPTVLSLLTFADAYPPTLIGALDVGWVPTIELTTHVRGRPAPGMAAGHVSHPTARSTACWRRPASCGTAPAARSPCPGSWPWCSRPGPDAGPHPGRLDGHRGRGVGWQ